MGYSPWGCKESGMTEQLTLTYLHLKTRRALGTDRMGDLLLLCFSVTCCTIRERGAQPEGRIPDEP